MHNNDKTLVKNLLEKLAEEHFTAVSEWQTDTNKHINKKCDICKLIKKGKKALHLKDELEFEEALNERKSC